MRDALDLYDLPFVNSAGESIPDYAIMQVGSGWTDANSRDYFNATKPNGSGKKFLINGPLAIATTTNANDGMASDKPGVYVRYTGSTPVAGEEWGPVSGSWAISASGSGYLIIGDVTAIGDAAVVRVAPISGQAGNVIYAQVVGAVTSGDPTFTFDNAVAVVGSIPSGGTGTAQNQYAQTYSDNDYVFLFQEKSSDQWLTERGGTSGSQVVYFELTQNKSYGDAAKLAKPVLPDGTMDAGADAFHVVDDKNQFYGRAAEGGADGFRGFGLRQWDDYSEGVPGFRIITMEGPALELIATLDEDLASPTDCTLAEDPAVFGLAQRGRIPAPVSMVDVQVYDDIGVATGAKSGEKWIVRWNEADERYCFWRRVEGPRYITIKGTTSAVSRSDPDFTLSEPVSVNGPVPSGTITVTNDPPINTPGGRTVYARYNVSIGTDDTDRWDTGDGGNWLLHARGLADWVVDEDQVLDHDADGDPHWHGTGPCEPEA